MENKILVSAYGKFDLFRWAEGFENKGLLYRLLTDFFTPKDKIFSSWRKDLENIPLEKVKTFFLPRILQPILRKVFKTPYWDNSLFDFWASKNIGDADIVISRSSTALNTFRAAKEIGAKALLYRGSSHIEYFRDIRKEEAELWGIGFEKAEDKKTVMRELMEYNICDTIYLPSTYAAQTFIKKGVPPEKIISFPLSTENFPSHEPNATKPSLKVLYVGNISIYKGVQYLLNAIKEAKKEVKVELTIAGPISPEIKPILRRHEGDFVYAGVVPHHLIGELYFKHNLFVFPAIDDGFGQVVLEAMSYGLPVIATNNCCGADVIQDGEDGFVVPFRNSEMIFKKILEFAKNPDFLESAGKKAAESSRKFSVEKFTYNWVEFFKRKSWI